MPKESPLGDTSPPLKKPDTLSTECLSQTRLFRIEKVKLAFSNGVRREYERVAPSYSHSAVGAVLIIPMLTKRDVLMVTEYGVGLDCYTLGFPKGGIAEGETAFEAANRELQEEVGYRANRLVDLGVVATSPAYLTTQMSVVLAEDLVYDPKQGDEPEALIASRHKVSKLSDLYYNSSFSDARCMAALWRLVASGYEFN